MSGQRLAARDVFSLSGDGSDFFHGDADDFPYNTAEGEDDESEFMAGDGDFAEGAANFGGDSSYFSGDNYVYQDITRRQVDSAGLSLDTDNGISVEVSADAGADTTSSADPLDLKRPLLPMDPAELNFDGDSDLDGLSGDADVLTDASIDSSETDTSTDNSANALSDISPAATASLTQVVPTTP